MRNGVVVAFVAAVLVATCTAGQSRRRSLRAGFTDAGADGAFAVNGGNIFSQDQPDESRQQRPGPMHFEHEESEPGRTRRDDDLTYGDTLPPLTLESDAVGRVREFIAFDSAEYEILEVLLDSHIEFFDDSANGGESNRMTHRLALVLKKLAQLSLENTVGDSKRKDVRLGVLSTFRVAESVDDVDENDLRYEGRSAHLVLVDINPDDQDEPKVISGVSPLAWIAKTAFAEGGDWAQIGLLRGDHGHRYTTVSVAHESCGATLDLAFMLDGSASVTRKNLWDDQIGFVKDFVSRFHIGLEDTRVAIVTCHGPLVSHFSIKEGVPNCPDGTVWEGDGKGCACPSTSSKCINSDPTGTAPGEGCDVGNYAYVDGACDDASDEDIDAGNVPDCERRDFFGHGCSTCTCSVLNPPYDKSDSYRLDQQFDATTTKEELDSLLDSLQSPEGATHLETCFEYVDNYIFRLGTGMRESGVGVPRAVIVITDGRSNYQFEPGTWLKAIKDKDIPIFSVGVDEYYPPEVELIASEPKVKHIFEVDDADAIDTIIGRLGTGTCELPGALEAGTKIRVRVDDDAFRYFKGECQGGNTLTPKLIIELSDVGDSETALYVARGDSNPSEINNDGAGAFDEPNKVLVLDRTLVGGENAIYASAFFSVRGFETGGPHLADLVFYQQVFVDYIYEASVAENQGPGALVVGARELAPVEGYEPSYSYSIDQDINGQGLFAVNPTTGAITTTDTLDREAKDEYTVKVWAVDEQHVCVRGYQLVKIFVSDENDNVPTFSKKKYVGTVTEDVESFDRKRRRVGEEPVQVQATDPDDGGITYEFLDGNEAGFFEIDEDTGVIRQVAKIDFEKTAGGLIVLRVVAVDHGGQRSLPATVEITVQDADDLPHFPDNEQHAAATFSNAQINSAVYLVPVIDDAITNDVSCSITNSAADLFKISVATVNNQRGCQIRIKDSLASAKDTTVTVDVELTLVDGGFSLDTASVDIEIEPANENAPQFDESNVFVSASLLEPVGSIIADVGVTDLDGNSFTCTVVSGNTGTFNENFEVDSTISGCVVKLANSFRPKAVGEIATLLLEVNDGGDHAQLDTATVRVEVIESCPVTSNCDSRIACAEGIDVSCECQDAALPGEPCEVDFCKSADPEDGNPCENGAVCRNLDIDYTCAKCPTTIKGKNCDEVQDMCEVNPCQNGGVCTRVKSRDDLDVLDSFQCECADGFKGQTCSEVDTSVDVCATTQPCKNGATCNRESTIPSGPKDTYSCECPEGFFGRDCTETRSDCSQNNPCDADDGEDECTGDCENQGVCKPSSTGGACQCTDAFYGQTCTNEDNSDDACESSPCLNGGTCIRASSVEFGPKDTFRCECPEGTDGDRCQLTDTNCRIGVQLPCNGRGSCTLTADGGSCACDNPNPNECFFGSVCQNFEPLPCSEVSQVGGGDDDGNGGNSSASIIGIAVGASIGIILLIVIIVLVLAHCGVIAAGSKQTHPAYEQESSFENPTFLAAGAVASQDDMNGVSNPFYGVNAAAPTAAGAAGTYDTVHKPQEESYDTVGAMMRPNSGNVVVDRGQLRLASINRSNPLNESSTDDPVALDNPTYMGDVARAGGVAGMTNPSYGGAKGSSGHHGSSFGNPSYMAGAGGAPAHGGASSMANPAYAMPREPTTGASDANEGGYFDPGNAGESTYATADRPGGSASLSNPMYDQAGQN